MEEDRYSIAKKKVNRIKAFYRHLMVYLSVNIVITAVHVVHDMRDGLSFTTAIWDLQTFFNWVPWGIGVLIHGIVVLDVLSFFMGKGWEEKKIKKLMEIDQQNSTMNWE